MDLRRIDVNGTPVEAYAALPPTGGGPGVLLVMDAFGLRPQIAAMADRIAQWGYAVLAPNVFHRSGSAAETSPTVDLREPGAREAFFTLAAPRIGALTVSQIEADLPAYLAALHALPGARRGPVGVIGFCMGARIAVRAAAISPEVVAVGGFHGGGLATDAPDSPHLSLRAARAEFVFGHADQDRSMDAAAVSRLGDALAEAGLRAVNEVYPGAAHGYSMADTSAYDEAATERMYAAFHALLDRALPSPPLTEVE